MGELFRYIKMSDFVWLFSLVWTKCIPFLFTQVELERTKKKKARTACTDPSCLLNPSSVSARISFALYSIISSILFQQFYLLQAKSFPLHPWETIPQPNRPCSKMLTFLKLYFNWSFGVVHTVSAKLKRIAEISKQKSFQKTKTSALYGEKQICSVQRTDRDENSNPFRNIYHCEEEGVSEKFSVPSFWCAFLRSSADTLHCTQKSCVPPFPIAGAGKEAETNPYSPPVPVLEALIATSTVSLHLALIRGIKSARSPPFRSAYRSYPLEMSMIDLRLPLLYISSSFSFSPKNSSHTNYIKVINYLFGVYSPLEKQR